MHDKQTIESAALEYLQRVLAKDRHALSTLLEARVGCNQALADDQHIITSPEGPSVSVIGLLNGLLNALGADPITLRCGPGNLPNVIEAFYQGRTVPKPNVFVVFESPFASTPKSSDVYVSYDREAARKVFKARIGAYFATAREEAPPERHGELDREQVEALKNKDKYVTEEFYVEIVEKTLV